MSEQTPLFGFMEHGYRFVIVLAIVSEAFVIVVLALFLAWSRRPGEEEVPARGDLTAATEPHRHGGAGTGPRYAPSPRPNRATPDGLD